jgi:phage baseplate assembly protein W
MTTTAFPFAVDPLGQVRTDDGDALRGRIIQVLFTSPGERVGLPDFGCGLLDLVFEPNDDVLAAAVRFTVIRHLNRWLGDLVRIDGVDVTRSDEMVAVELAYTRRADRQAEGLRVRFHDAAPWRTG